jgi:hypothetical protein
MTQSNDPLTSEEWTMALQDKESADMWETVESPRVRLDAVVKARITKFTALRCLSPLKPECCTSEMVFGYKECNGTIAQTFVLQCGLPPSHMGRHGCTHEIHPLASKSGQTWLVEWDDVATSRSS